MKLIDQKLLEKVSSLALENERLRMNYNFHDTLDAPAQCLLNALQPGTVVPVHRHPHTAETYIILSGKIRMLYYNDQKEVTDEAVLDGTVGNYGVHIPKNQWHALEVLEKNTVIFEVKDGPYCPLDESNILK